MEKKTRIRNQDKLERLAWGRFLKIIGNHEVPAIDADNLVIGTIQRENLLILKVSLAPPDEDFCEQEIPIDNHGDTKELCRLAVDPLTEGIDVTIVNEMPWLKRSNI